MHGSFYDKTENGKIKDQNRNCGESRPGFCDGATLATTGTAIAVALAKGLSTDETNILGALFTVIGDQLTLIATTESACQGDSAGKTSDSKQTGENTAGKAFIPDTGPGKKNAADKAVLPDAVRKF